MHMCYLMFCMYVFITLLFQLLVSLHNAEAPFGPEGEVHTQKEHA